MNTEQHIQPADPAARRRALLVVVAMAVLGSLLVYGFTRASPEIAGWLEQHVDVALRYPMIGAGIGLLLVAPVFGAAVYLFVMAQRVVKNRRLPPPGQPVVRDTPIREGAEAVRRGRVLQLAAALLALAAAAFPVWCWRLLSALAAAS